VADEQRSGEQVSCGFLPYRVRAPGEGSDAAGDLRAGHGERVARWHRGEQLAGQLRGDLLPQVVHQQEAGFQVAVQHEHGGSGRLLDLRPGTAAGEIADGEGTQVAGIELHPRAVTAVHQAERAGQVETVEDIELAGQPPRA
jgi:hypothetical protein